MTPPAARADRRLWTAFLAAYAAAFFAGLLHAFFVHFDGFYVYTGDDVTRIALASEWAQAPTLHPTGDWLPLPGYLLGALLAVFPFPQTAPALWHAVLGTLTLLLAGAVGRRLFPEKPAAAAAAAVAASAAPLYRHISLAPASEADLWFFALLSVWAWLKHLESGRRRHLALNALALFLTTMTRYEGWFFCAAFVTMACLHLRKRGRPAALIAAYALAATGFVWMFIAYQELHMNPDGVPPFSYRGVRLGVSKMKRSFLLPLALFLKGSPALAALSIAGVALAWRRRKDALWLAAVLGLALVPLCAMSALFGFPPKWERLLVLYYLLAAPYAAFLAVSLPARPVPAAALAVGLAAVLLSLRPVRQPQAEGLFWRSAAMETVARASRDLQRLHGWPPPRVLAEINPAPGRVDDHVVLRLPALDGLFTDRAMFVYDDASQVESVFHWPADKLLVFLAENRVDLIVTHSEAASRAAAAVAAPVANVGTLEVFSRPRPRPARAFEKALAGQAADLLPTDSRKK